MMTAAKASFPPAAEAAGVPPVPWPRIDRFVGQLTHDVRNGLNAIELQLTLLDELSADAEVAAEVRALRGTLLDITRQLQHLRVITEPVTAHLLPYPAADFCEDLRDRFQRLHPDAIERVAWEINVGASPLPIDPELSLSALLELLGNALHFGAPQAVIGFLAEAREDGGVSVTLREPGAQAPAIAPADWGRTPLLTTRRNAYGLGLFRVRQIIEAQGGTLDADYSPTNQVLLTTITLPGAGAPPAG